MYQLKKKERGKESTLQRFKKTFDSLPTNYIKKNRDFNT